MNGAVRIVRLSVENVGIHDRRVDLGELSPQLNVISGGNESGKSTLIKALRATLFEKHEAKHSGIKELQTYNSRLAPEVWVELDLGNERVHVYRRFLEKPITELRDVDGGLVRLRGSDVDQYLLQRLGGHQAKSNRGTKPGDMGLWGLLWIAQDETAYSDPVALLDDSKDGHAEEVRGALAEVVGRQVGQIIGGRQGERVRSRVLEHLATFFTGKRGDPTGDYAKAIEAKHKIDQHVAKIEQAVREIEDYSLEHQRKSGRLRELDRQRQRLEQEHEAARHAVQRAGALRSKEQQVGALHEAARMRLEVARKALADRQALQGECADRSTELERLRTEQRGREQVLAAQLEELREAQQQAGSARQEAIQRGQELATLSRSLDRERRTQELNVLMNRLADAEQTAIEQSSIRQLMEKTLNASDYERVKSLSDRIREQRALVEKMGTRLLLEQPGRETRIFPVAVTYGGEIEGVGRVTIEAARPGLAEATERLRQTTIRLEQALQENGVTDLQQAREQRAAVQADEEESEQIRTRLTELAPEGIESLASSLEVHSARRQRGDEALHAARQAAAEVAKFDESLKADPFDETTIQALREVNQRALSAQAACAQAGTLVSLHALKPVKVRIGDGASQPLKAGEHIPTHPLTEQTTLLIDDRIEVTLQPRGQDLTRLKAQQERTEAELQRQLAQLEVSDLAMAESRASVRAQQIFARDAALERLQSLAPKGIRLFSEQLESSSRECVQLERAMKESRQLDARLRLIEERQRGYRITKAVLNRLEKLGRELTKLQTEQQRFAARLTCVAGPLAAALATASDSVLVCEPLRYMLTSELTVTVIPGETEAGAELVRTEQQLAAELAAMSIPDWGEAEARFREGIHIQSQFKALERRLSELAPEGLEVLRNTATDKRNVLDSIAVVDVQIPENADPGLLLRQAETLVRTDELTAKDAERVAESRRQAFDTLDRESQRMATTLENNESRLKTLQHQLETARLSESDESLAAHQRRAVGEQETAHSAWKRAQDDLEGIALDELQEDELRAAQTVRSWREQRDGLHSEVVRLQTLLGQAATEGRFELLTDAKVAQAAATAELLRLEREAQAARRLADVVQAVYEAEQQRFLAPVLTESKPYLKALRPGTELRLSANFKLEKVLRDGAEEEFGQLSGGTREQLAVIVRLALARVLAKDSRPLPLILDDPMGWTDDERFMTMVRILRSAARDLQVIVLTCHPERFLRLQADYSVDLDVLKREGTREALHSA